MSISHLSRLRRAALLCSVALVLASCSSAQDQTESSAPAASTASTGSSAPSASAVTVNPTPSISTTTPTVTETENSSDSTDSVTEPTAEQTTVPAADENQAAAEGSSSTTVVGTPTCNYGQIHLAAQVADGGGAAGSRYINLTFTNSGSAPCTISGYPAVNYVDSSGNHIGSSASQAAEWTSSARVLSPGSSATAILRETRANLYDTQTCQITTATGYRVSIPGTSSSFVIDFPAEACSSTAVTQLSVGQVGATTS